MTWSRRRLGLAGTVALVLIVSLVLLAVRLGGDDGARDAAEGGGASLPPSSTARPGVLPPGATKLAAAASVEAVYNGARLRLDVQPLVRSGSLTVLTAQLTAVQVPDGDTVTIGDNFAARGEPGAGYDLSDVRLFAPEPGLLARPATSAGGKPATTRLGNESGLKVGETAGLRIVYGALPAEVRRADVLWPTLGVIPGLPVVDGELPPVPPFDDEPEPRDVDLAGVTGQVRPVTARAAELEGAVTTERAPERTKVVLAADVLFALDRADLSPQASAALDRAVAQIEAAGPGPVRVTGHTDDQGTEQYNLDLSRRRAQAVATALAPRLAPDRYPLEVSGRGEAEPAATGTTPEARSANRRVELLVERRQRSEPVPAPSAPPSGGGPAATGAEGLTFRGGGDGRDRLRAERAVRQGSWLRIDLSTTREPGNPAIDDFLDLRDVPRGRLQPDTSGAGVLDGSVVRLAAVDATGTCACASDRGGSILPMEPRRFSVWVASPSRLGPTVAVQLPRNQGRLVDVPVTS